MPSYHFLLKTIIYVGKKSFFLEYLFHSSISTLFCHFIQLQVGVIHISLNILFALTLDSY